MAKKTRIYADAIDKNVAAVIVYAGEEDGLFYDEECENRIPEVEVEHLIFNGMVLFGESMVVFPMGIDLSNKLIYFPPASTISYADPEPEEDEEPSINPDPNTNPGALEQEGGPK